MSAVPALDPTGAARRPRPSGGSLLVALALLGVLAGCARTGEATIRVGEAEQRIAAAVDGIVESLALEVGEVPDPGPRRRCEQVTGAEGLSSSVSVRAPLPEVDDPLGRAGAVLLEHGFDLVEGQLDEGVFGRRDGMRVTVVPDRPTGELALDASTGCRYPDA